jgi:hypothetical protein
MAKESGKAILGQKMSVQFSTGTPRHERFDLPFCIETACCSYLAMLDSKRFFYEDAENTPMARPNRRSNKDHLVSLN